MRKSLLTAFIFSVIMMIALPMSAALSDYTFVQAAGQYTELTAPIQIHGPSTDDTMSGVLDIGFTFILDDMPYTQFKANSNGFATLNVASTASLSNNLTLQTLILAGLWDDTMTSTNGSVSYQLMGTAPNRMLVIQYKNLQWYYSVSANLVNFQIVLNETTNAINYIYGAVGAAPGTSASASIGVTGAALGNYVSVTPATPTATYSSTTANNAINATHVPYFTGAMYTFAPPVAVPNDMQALAITGNSTPTSGTPATFQITIRNRGTVAQSTYSVKLMSGTTELATVAGPAIQPDQILDVPITHTFTATGPIAVFGRVVLAGDQNPANDNTAPINLNVQASGTVAVTIGTGDLMERHPIDFYWMNSLYECIYLSSEINLGGLITGIAFYNNFVTNLPGKPTSLWLGETTNADLSADWIPSTQLTQVFTGVVDYPAGANTITITFTTPYTYGGGNLVLMAHRPMDTAYFSSSDDFQCQTIGTSRARYLYSDSVTFDPAAPATTTPIGTFPKATLYFVTQGMGALSGTVTSGGSPLAGATVAIANTPASTMTAADGTYSFPYVAMGAQTVTCNKIGYQPQSQNVTIIEDQTVTQNFNMIALPVVNVTGQVVGSDQPTVGLEGAEVFLTGMADYTATTNATGNYTITGVFTGQDYDYTVTVPGYQQATGTITVGTTNYTLNVTCNEIAIPANTVQAVEVSPVVNVTWEAPGTGGGEWIRWDSGMNDDSIGTGGAADFDVASRWPVADLTDYVGMTLFAVEYFPAQAASFSIRVWTGGGPTIPGTMVVDQVITNPVLGEFNTVLLDNPVPIQAGQELWFGYRANATAGYPAGCDAGPAHDGLGNMMYFDGAWSTLLAIAPSLNYDWNIAGYVGYSAPTARPMQLQPIAFNYDRISEGRLSLSNNQSRNQVVSAHRDENTRVLTGYKVWRLLQGQETNEAAWTQLTPNTITATAYTDANWATVADGTYKWAVKAIYTNNVASIPAFSNTVQKLTQIGTISGIVRQANNAPIVGATITSGTYTATSNATGAYSLQIPAGTHTVTCTAPGYVPGTQTGVVVVTGQTTIVNFVLTASGIVINESFEGATFPPAGWTQVITDTGPGANGVLPTWCRVGTIAITPAIVPPDGAWQAAMWWSYAHQEEWLKTPEFMCPLDAELRFNGYIFLGSTNNDHYYVKVSTNGGSTWTTLWDAVTQTPAGAYSDYNTPIIISLDDYAGQDIMLAWHAEDPPTNDGMWNVAAIDNVIVEGETANEDPVTPIVATALNGNYPNPFNPETSISYSVKDNNPVVIEIFNTKGQRVKTLVNETKAPGNYSVNWNGTDENNQRVSSGVYFYKMNAGKYSSSKKMILMK